MTHGDRPVSRLGPLVPGSGPSPSPYALFGEAPGFWESRARVPFVGASGQFLDSCLQHLPYGFSRSSIYVDNVFPRRPPDNRDPTPEELEENRPRLIRTLRRVRPRVIGAVGRIAASYLINQPVDLYMDHGCAFEVDNPRLEWSGVVVPIYHPAAGLRSPDLLGTVFWDMEQWGAACADPMKARPMQEEKRPPVIPAKLPGPAVDTEGVPGKPWCMTWTIGRKALFSRKIAGRFVWEQPILHNAPWDIRVLASAGVSVWSHLYHDTMLLAYLLCYEPQSLKALSWRTFRYRQMTYEELTEADHLAQLKQWLTALSSLPLSSLRRPDPVLVEDRKTGKDRVLNPQPLKPRIAALLRAIDAGRITPAQILKRWSEIPPVVFEPIAKKRWFRELNKRALEHPACPVFLLQPPDFTLSHVVDQAAVESYAKDDAHLTACLYPVLRNRVADQGLSQVYEMTRRILPMLARMEQVGILVSPSHLQTLADEWKAEMRTIRRHIEKTWNGGRPFNPGSGQQVRELVFNRLGWTTRRRTKITKQEATDEKALMPLARVEPAVDAILRYTKLATLHDDFAVKLLPLIQSDGRIHARSTYTRTATGRLAMRDPNLQQIPSRSKQGRRIREAFIAKPGHALLSVDLNQVEMRVMADESGDQGLIDAYRAGRDVHSDTASLMFGFPLDKLDPLRHRYPAKTTGFGIINGMSGAGLRDQFQMSAWEEDEPSLYDYSLSDCEEFVEGWFRARPGVRLMMAESAAEARRYGYVRDRWGRKRYLPAVWLNDEYAKFRAEAERQASSMKIQSGAQGVEQKGMFRVWNLLLEWWNQGWSVEPLLQIHDELIFEVEEGRVSEVQSAVIQAMEADSELFEIPIKAKGKSGLTWGGLE